MAAALRRPKSDVAEFGAIFMANKRTMEECFSRRLFGLPSPMKSFVGGVRSGMILFLFEYETRSLHGVFEAVSDGAVDIVPAAYASSGKRFPAQVRFEKIWDCEALREGDFREAIEANYFAKFKFRFGLTYDQVCKLLWLFNSRRKNATTIRNLSCESSRRSVDSESEMLASSRRKLSAVKLIVSESSLSRETVKDKILFPHFSGNSGTSMSYFGCDLGADDFDEGSRVIPFEEELKKSKTPTKVNEADLGDFIPLDSLDNPDHEIKSTGKLESSELGDFIPLSESPDNPENEAESPGNNQTEFMPFERYVPVRLMSCEYSGNQQSQKSQSEDIAQKFDASDGNGSQLCVKGLYSDDQVDRSSGSQLCVKGLYSDDQVDRSSVFARLKFGSSNEDKLDREHKGNPEKRRGKEKKSVFSRLSVSSRLKQSIIDIVSDQHHSAAKETELAHGDREVDSESIHARWVGGEKSKGKDTVQDIMGSLLQRHHTWKKTDPMFEQEDMKPAAKKNVFSRLSWASASDHDVVNVTVPSSYAQGYDRARQNRPEEQWSARSYSKRSRDSEASNPDYANKENFENARINKRLKRQAQVDKRDCVSGLEFERNSEELPRKKLVRPLFDPTPKAKTTNSETGLRDQIPSGGSSKESTGSCEGPTKDNIAQDKVTFLEEVKTTVDPLNCIADFVVKESESEDLLVGELKAGGGHAVATPLRTYKRRAKRVNASV